VLWESPSTATPAKAISLKPEWINCTNFGFSAAESSTNLRGCKFELMEPNVSMEGNVAIRCPSGEFISLHGQGFFFSTCEVIISEVGNTNLAKNVYKNLGGTPSKFEVSFQLTGITAEVAKSTGLCGMTVGVINDATYTTQVILEDKFAKAGVSIG